MNTIALSAVEMSELASCEMVIEHGLRAFQAAGVALLTIREKRLYRAGFSSFEEYCQSKWGFTDERARLLMRGAEVITNLTETPTIVGVLPANEAQVRPLISLPPDQQREAWQEAVETAPNGKVTGAHVERVAQQFKPINSHRSGVRTSTEGVEPDLDEDGLPLVDRLNAAANERFAGQVDLDEDEAIPSLDGEPISDSHPEGFRLFYKEYSWATCVHCGESHARWSYVRGSDWRCDLPDCKQLTHDDALIPYTREDRIAADRNVRRNRNGKAHKPNTLVNEDPTDDDADNDEWGTPEEWIVRARAFLGGIDTDPASNPAAQRIVRAKTFYTKQDSGLQQDWHGRVWLNPPYSHPLVDNFTGEALRQYERGNISECLILVNNQTGAFWFQRLLARADAVCFIKGRINFIHPVKENPGNRQAQVLFYLGKRADDFVLEFSDHGVPMHCMWAREEAGP